MCMTISASFLEGQRAAIGADAETEICDQINPKLWKRAEKGKMSSLHQILQLNNKRFTT